MRLNNLKATLVLALENAKRNLKNHNFGFLINLANSKKGEGSHNFDLRSVLT